MTENSIFLISEIWLNSDKFEDFKIYRQKTIEILIKYNAEYIYHGHPFEWSRNQDGEKCPTGIEIFHFSNEEDIRKALEELNDSALKEEEAKIFNKVRSYLSKYAISKNWSELNLGK
jgi:hypothetical protein